MDTNTTTTKLSAEEIQRRKDVAAANLEALTPFIDAAKEAVAADLGCGLDFVNRVYGTLKDISQRVRDKAKELKKAHDIANGILSPSAAKGAPTPKWLGKVSDAFLRVFEFARNHNIVGDVLQGCLDKAVLAWPEVLKGIEAEEAKLAEAKKAAADAESQKVIAESIARQQQP